MLSSRFAGIPISSSIIDGSGVPQLLNRGEQTLTAVTGSGGRLHFGTVADIKSESPAGLRRNSHTGEDATTIGRKYKSAWTGQLQTRFLILSNELFRLADASGALASRFILLMLTKSFYGQEDRNLTKKLMTELPGILNWAVAGWVRLERRSHFLQPDSAKEAVEQLEELASPISAFVRECCDIGAAHSVASDSLFVAWQFWCKEQGRDHPGTKQSFGRDLKAAHPGLKVMQPREEGRQLRRHYQGIRLKPDDAADDDSI